MSENPKMLWVARDEDEAVWVFDAEPFRIGNASWDAHGHTAELDHTSFPNIQPGECRMFVEFAPRVATVEDYRTGPERLRWANGAWGYISPIDIDPGDIILPMPPDPTPYMTQADSNAARREEIRAQIAALQAELDGMEG